MGEGSGFGKVILFNEHFVVYGVHAIASAIDNRTVARVEPVGDEEELIPSGNEGSMAGSGWVLEDDRPANEGYKTEKLEHQRQSLELLFNAAGFDPTSHPIKIWMGGDLKAVGGVGASAAVCVSVARALNNEFGLGFDDKEINRIAYEGEKAYAGTPSGIDNTASTYGGLIWFKKGGEGGENELERIELDRPLYLVMGNTGITANTKAAVAGVKERYERNPDGYGRIFSRAKELGFKAREALEALDPESIGVLMNENHELLQRIEVSHPALDQLVDTAREHGALGAKMTGGGLGGYMVALAPDPASQQRIAKAMEEAGFEALVTSVGVNE